jgi:hypothetical protein
MSSVSMYFVQFSDFSVCITQRTVRRKRGVAGGRWYSLVDLTEAAFDGVSRTASAIGSQLS